MKTYATHAIPFFASEKHSTFGYDVKNQHPACLPVPAKATKGSAAFDLQAWLFTDINDEFTTKAIRRDGVLTHTFPNHRVYLGYDPVVISTGWKIIVPPGYVGEVCSRSGLAAKNGLYVLNAPGIIDCDYTGVIKVVLAFAGIPSEGSRREYIEHGDRIAQLLFKPLASGLEAITEIEAVDTNTFNKKHDEMMDKAGISSNRGEGGFGSTGT